jgi:inhibitor of KinA sporulation pathway (predicted exonuclease)
MCRYAWHNYRDHFACFDCRKAFKYWQWAECDEEAFRAKQRLQHVPRKILCPDCSKPMTDMGLDFKAPRRTDVEAWKMLEALAQNGFKFQGCGCDVGLIPPRTLREVPQWLEQHRRKSDVERQLATIDRRAKARRENRKPKMEP